MGKGGGGGAMPQQPSYEKGLTEALKAQVGLLKGTGEFAEIAPEGLAGLVPLEAEVRQLSTQADTDAIQTALLGGFTTANADGKVIKAYSDKPMEGGSSWDNWAPTVQQDMENALDAIWELGQNPNASYDTTSATIGSGLEKQAGIKLLRQMGYDIPEDAKDSNYPNDPGRLTARASIDKFFKDAGWEMGTAQRVPGGGLLDWEVIGGSYDAKAGYERAVGAGADVPREPIYDEKTYAPGAKVRDPLQPGLVDLLGSSEAITSGRSSMQEARYNEMRGRGSAMAKAARIANFSDEERAEYDELKQLGAPTTRKPGFDENDQFLGLSKLGEDLRIQGASAGRAADIADIEANMDRFQAIMEKVRPETSQMLDDAVKVIDEQGKRLIGENFAISKPNSMEDLATSIQRLPPDEAGKLSPQVRDMAAQMSPTPRATAEKLGVSERAPGAQILPGERTMAEQIAGVQRDEVDPMALGERGKAEQIEGLQRGAADQMAGFQDLGMAGLRGTLQAQAQADLDAGRGLSPRQRIEAEQSARQAWEARGLVRDPEAVVSEVESVMEARGAEEARRRAFAGGVLGQEAGLRTGELGRGMGEAEFNIQNEIARQEANIGREMGAQQQNIQSEIARQEANLGRRLTEQEFNLIQETSRQEANIARTMGAQESNVQREVARQEANLGRQLTTQEFNALQDAARQEANIEREMQTGQFNIQNEVARQEANLGRQLTAEEFNIVQETGRQQEIGAQDLAAQQYNIGQEVARQETNIGRQMSGGMTDLGAKMDQERLNEQLRQQGIMGYMGATTQLAALEDAQQQKLDPFQAILSRPSSSGVPGFGMGQQIGGSAGYGLTAGPQYVSPESGLGYIQSQAANQANMWAAQQQAQATKSAGVMGGLGAIGGGIATGFIMGR